MAMIGSRTAWYVIRGLATPLLRPAAVITALCLTPGLSAQGEAVHSATAAKIDQNEMKAARGRDWLLFHASAQEDEIRQPRRDPAGCERRAKPPSAGTERRESVDEAPPEEAADDSEANGAGVLDEHDLRSTQGQNYEEYQPNVV